jgi:two-component system cell cycle sensor histidine kinase/response regulator CckA
VGYLLLQPQLEATDPPRLAGATLLVVDMTRERRLARELQRSQRLELVGRLSSGIAHDFNNLLTVILGLGHLVQTALGPDHVAAEDVARILEVAEQASNLSQQLLDFSKQRKVPLRAVEVTRVIRRTVDVLRTLMPQNILLECRLPRSEVILHADEMQLQQVLMNLCLNARDAMQEGGRLQIWAERIGEPALEWLRLSVHDSGTGMTEAIRTHIFDPFFTTKELGSGLGLAVVQQIVDSFGGHIRVESELGLGSRFEVWLPLRFNLGEAI